MELPQTVEWALHCCWLLAQAPDDESLTARRLAEFYGLPEPYLAKVLKALTSANLLTARSGSRGGYRLARDPEQISALDIIIAVDGQRPMFRCAEIRQNGPVGLTPAQCRHTCGIASLMHRAEHAWRDQLASTSLADLLADSATTGSTSRAARWLTTDQP
jgi:Rrf2 family protein